MSILPAQNTPNAPYLKSLHDFLVSTPLLVHVKIATDLASPKNLIKKSYSIQKRHSLKVLLLFFQNSVIYTEDITVVWFEKFAKKKKFQQVFLFLLFLKKNKLFFLKEVEKKQAFKAF